MIFDFSKLKGLMKEKGFTQELVAKEINIACSTFNLKLNGNTYFGQDEILKIANLLGIDKERLYDYFFVLKVKKTKQVK